MKYGSDFKFDLEVGKVFERQLGSILENKKIEVKRDFKALYTGNIFVEYESRNKPSGIATSEADYYCYVLNNYMMVLIATEHLKNLCRPFLNTNRDRRGGDFDTSKGILLPLKMFYRGQT